MTATTTLVTSAPNPSVFGQVVTFTATVTPLGPSQFTPTGSVTFAIGDGPTLTGTVGAGGIATVTTGALPTGTHTVTATYGGDTNFTGSSGITAHAVVKASTTTAVTSSPDPSSSGQTVTITARVTASPPGAVVPTGTVTFVVGGVGGLTLTRTLDATGTATVTTSSLGVGVHSITAVYEGDTRTNPSSGTDTHIVTQASTTTAVNVSPAISVFGQAVTISATVTGPPGAGTPTGTVTFTISGRPTVTIPLDASGVATLTTTDLAVGAHSITAVYNGAPGVPGSTGTGTHTVDKARTATRVSSSTNPSVTGQSVTLTAVVAVVPPGAGTPTGSVTFAITGGPSLTAPLGTTGTATVHVPGLPAGSYPVTATYSGDDNVDSSSGTTTQTVNRAGTTTAVTADPHVTVFGQTVTVTTIVSAVTPGAGTATGAVRYTIEGTNLTFTPTDGAITVTIFGLPVGTHTVAVTYLGDVNFTGSSGSVTFTVEKARTTVSLTSSPNPSTPGQSVTYTSTVTPMPPGAGLPTGSVAFILGGAGGGTVAVPLTGQGKAMLVSSSLGSGEHTVTAQYNGDARFLGSSQSITQTVSPAQD
ncbi:Ig-like domain repeat protein [Streptomyces asiaticus]|uniref:Ig-like domain repeat protein n=1 Tax=Streptomyces asiaticus TaxID=114695 RepID=UPI003D7568FC